MSAMYLVVRVALRATQRHTMRAVAVAAIVCGCVPAGISPMAWADELSDEFDNARSLANWKVRERVERGPQTFTLVEMGKSRKGWLTVVPRPGHAWFRDGMGPMLYKHVEGDFLVETQVVAQSRNASGSAPRANYNSAGMIVRDPASVRGRQNWVVVNTGFQNGFTGSEAKTTVNSKSQLELQRGSHQGRLRLARIGTTIYCLRMLDGEDTWTLIREVERSDLPARVQVGLICNGWTNQSDLVARFDYMRFGVLKQKSDLVRKSGTD